MVFRYLLFLLNKKKKERKNLAAAPRLSGIWYKEEIVDRLLKQGSMQVSLYDDISFQNTSKAGHGLREVKHWSLLSKIFKSV